MRLYQYPRKIIPAISLLLIGSSAMAANEVGQVKDVDIQGWVERNGKESEISKTDKFELGDTLFVKRRPSNNKLTLLFDNDEGLAFGSIELSGGGKVRLFGGSGSSVNCEVIGGIVRFSEKPCEGVLRDGDLEVKKTIYEVDVQAKSTRLFVYEGLVSVYSTNPKYPEPRHVYAGEWVRFRKGEPIPKPRKFTMAIGPGSGSTECIYSDCKLVNNVLIPNRPVVTPQELTPPPQNPQGQR